MGTDVRIWVSIPLYGHVYRALRLALVFAFRSVPQSNPAFAGIAGLGSLFPQAPVSALELQSSHHAHSTLCGAGNPGSGPLPCVESTLTTELSLQTQTGQI